MKLFLRIAIFEFLSKGLTWLRVLLAAFLMSDETYGLLILFISAEALLGGLASFPQIRSVLLLQRNDISEIKHTAQLLAIATLFAIPILIIFFPDPFDIALIVAGAALFAGYQILIYILRVTDVKAYNTAKVFGAVLSTTAFLSLTPLNPRYFLVASALSFTMVVLFWWRQPRENSAVGTNLPSSKAVSFWGIFGLQSLLVNLGQYGSRFIIGAAFGLVEVAVFTKAYMVASGVSFAFASINVYGEKRLSKPAKDNDDRHSKSRFARIMLGVFFLSWIAYIIITSVFLKFGLIWFAEQIAAIDIKLLFIFHTLFFVQIFYLVINPLVISEVAPFVSLKATVISLCVQIGTLTVFWSSLTLASLAGILLVGQVVRVCALYVYYKFSPKFCGV